MGWNVGGKKHMGLQWLWLSQSVFVLMSQWKQTLWLLLWPYDLFAHLNSKCNVASTKSHEFSLLYIIRQCLNYMNFLLLLLLLLCTVLLICGLFFIANSHISLLFSLWFNHNDFLSFFYLIRFQIFLYPNLLPPFS